MSYPASRKALLALLLLPLAAGGAPARAADAPAPTRPASHRPRPVVRRPLGEGARLELPAEAFVAAGGLSGEGARDLGGPILELGAALRPRLVLRDPRLELRLRLAHRRRETLGFSLAERTTGLGLSARWRPVDAWTVEAGGGLTWVDRPDWPDLYQPLLDARGEPTGDYAPTDRYSRFDGGLYAGVAWRSADGVRLRLRTEVLSRAYTLDPAYDPVDRPTHLVPGDFTRAGLALRADRRFWDGRWRARLEVRGELLDFPYAYARDAGTGRTHAAPGGPPPNPRLAYRRFTLAHRSSVLFPGPRLRLVVELAYAHNDDTYAGYYTWNAVEAALTLRVPVVRGVRAEVGWAGLSRGYTDTGYQPGTRHPALDDGSLLRGEGSSTFLGRVTWDAWSGPGRSRARVRPFVEASWTSRTTNFPDYVPEVNPVGAPYDIRFDYVNLRAVAGVEGRI